MAMSKKHLYVLIVVLVIPLASADFASAENGYFTSDNVNLILAGIRRIITDNIGSTTAVMYRGQIIPGEVATSVGNVIVRLLVMSQRGGIEFCAMNPNANDVIQMQTARGSFIKVLNDNTLNVIQYLPAAAWMRTGRYIIQYWHEGFRSIDTLEGAVEDVPGHYCIRNGLLSGPDWPIESTLYTGESLYSPDETYRMDMQGDCNVVLYRTTDGKWLWGTDTAGKGTNCNLRLEPDGILVLRDGNGSEIWRSTVTRTGTVLGSSFMDVQNDCNAVVYSSTGLNTYEALWQSGQSRCN